MNVWNKQGEISGSTISILIICFCFLTSLQAIYQIYKITHQLCGLMQLEKALFERVVTTKLRTRNWAIQLDSMDLW